MKRVVVLLMLAIASVAAAQADPFVGIFKDENLLVMITKNAATYQGTITMGGKEMPLEAVREGTDLKGKFKSGETAFDFTATLERGTLVLKSGKSTYELARVAGGAVTPATPVNPDPPAIAPKKESAPTQSQQIEEAIKKAKEYLRSQQRNGTWDPPARAREPRPNARGEVDVRDVMAASQWGGVTALVTYALLASGESPQDPDIKKAIDFLKTAEINGTYALACRALVWHQMPANRWKEYLEFAKKDRDLLLKNKRTNEWKGFFRYLPDDVAQGYDHSASQFAVLGLWACDEMGAEVPTEFWKEAEAAWHKTQNKDGGWGYSTLIPNANDTTPSMTAAGVATLFITLDMLHAGKAADCRGNITSPEIEKGMAWMTKNYDRVFRGDWPMYTLYGVERISLASGYKYFGTQGWYQHGVARLLASQMPNGSWRDFVPDTCFGILFLVRGRAPIMMNKLQYALDAKAGERPGPTNWNQRPRDCSNLTKWVGRQLEREINWQIVNLKGSVDDLHDAPILYISGNQVLSFSAEDEAKLKQFAEQGGLIIGHADCSHLGFANSFKKLGTKLFGGEFRDLPANHVLYNSMYSKAKWKPLINAQGLSNGARELMLIIPTGDPARSWQTFTVGGKESHFELMANAFMYMTEKKDLRYRGETHVVKADATATPAATIKLARIEHGGNWNPEPGGWRRLDAVMRNDHGIALQVETVKLGEGKLAGYKIAHLTTTSAFKLTDAQRAELKDFVTNGGTLIADAAGGVGEGAAAIEAELAPLGKIDALANDHPILKNLGLPVDEIAFRPYAAKQVGNARGPRLRAITIDNRPAVIYSPYDLSVGLVGMSIDGIAGYTPASATAIVKSIVLSTK